MELAGRHLLRMEFWKQLLERARTKTQLHARIGSGTENWIQRKCRQEGPWLQLFDSHG